MNIIHIFTSVKRQSFSDLAKAIERKRPEYNRKSIIQQGDYGLFVYSNFYNTKRITHYDTTVTKKSSSGERTVRLGQMQPDFETQFEEFKAIVHSVLYSESGYLAIAQSLDEALGLLEECLPSKKRT